MRASDIDFYKARAEWPRYLQAPEGWILEDIAEIIARIMITDPLVRGFIFNNKVVSIGDDIRIQETISDIKYALIHRFLEISK